MENSIFFLRENRFRRCRPSPSAVYLPVLQAPVERPVFKRFEIILERRHRRTGGHGTGPQTRQYDAMRDRGYTKPSEDTKLNSLPEFASAVAATTTTTTCRWRVGTSCFQDSQKQPLSSSQTTPTGASLRSTTHGRPVLGGIFVIYTHLHARALTGTAGVSFYVHRMLPPKHTRRKRFVRFAFARVTSRNNSRRRPCARHDDDSQAKTAGKISLRDRYRRPVAVYGK